MKLKYWIAFIALNILVSAATTLALLSYWEQTHPLRYYEPAEPAAQAQAALTPSATLGRSTAAPQPTAIPSPPAFTPTAPGPTIYTVQSGDTLSSISRRFNVPLRDLLAANNLTVNSILYVGQEIVVPLAGQAAAAASPTASPTSPSSELSPPTGPVKLEIRQVIARGDPAREAVVIANLGRQVNLQGWKLKDNDGDSYAFPDLTLWPNGTITLHTGSGADSVSDLYWKRSAPVWAEPGDVATLLDASGNVAAQYQLP